MFETKILEDYKGFGKCLYMTNGIVDIIASLDLGPRILRYGYVGEDNIFIADTENKCIVHQTSDELKRYYGDEHFYCTYGGHRVWQAPEVHPKSHYPDNFPIEHEILENGVKLTAPVQMMNNIQISITLTFRGEGTEIDLHQEIKNASRRTQELALWTITMCATGGTALMRRNTMTLPGNPNMNLALWRHANFTNNTIYIGNKYMSVVQPTNTSMKLGFQLEHGDTYYVNGDTVFKKQFTPNYPYGNYTDGNSNFEIYSCPHFTELEALSELTKLAPYHSITLDESWSLCRKPCDLDPKNDDSIGEFLSKL